MKKAMLLIALILVLSITIVNAQSYVEKITVYYDVVKTIMIDGVEKTPTDQKPFIYEGTTYVPLRFVSESLGKKVSWDEKTGTIYIGETPTQAQIPGKTYLTDLGISYYSNMHLYRIDNRTESAFNRDMDASNDFSDGFIMSMKIDPITAKVETFSKGISVKMYENMSSLTYPLSKKYSQLTGFVGFDETMNDKDETVNSYIVRFIVDNELKKEIELKKNSHAEYIDIDVSNGKELSIQFVSVDESKNKNKPMIDLVDMVLE
ncbi:MAG: stalk domain-containing protein [Bacillota bacterium]